MSGINWDVALRYFNSIPLAKVSVIRPASGSNLNNKHFHSLGLKCYNLRNIISKDQLMAPFAFGALPVPEKVSIRISAQNHLTETSQLLITIFEQLWRDPAQNQLVGIFAQYIKVVISNQITPVVSFRLLEDSPQSPQFRQPFVFPLNLVK